MQDEIDILGVKINNFDKQSLHKRVIEMLSRKGCSVIFTPNPEMVIAASRNDNISRILSNADLRIADGSGLLLASNILGDPLQERLAGIELGEFLLEFSAKKSISIYLLGGKDGVAELAQKKLEAKYKGLKICGAHHGFFEMCGEENDEVIRQINTASPDIIFVCMGFPRQERWICENKDKIPSLRLALGLGGSLDVWSGQIARAPKLLRKISLEWLYRIVKEPKRASFIAKIPVFLFKVIAQRLSRSRKLREKNGENAHKF